MNLLNRIVLVLAASMPVQLFAQQVTPQAGIQTPGAPVDVIATAHGLERLDGVLVGGGRGYRAVFHPGGPEFIPALGKKAQRLYPLRLTLESIRRGDASVYRVSESSPARESNPRQNGNTATYDRGAVSERYEVRADGVEQSYLFPERPAGRGDLIVRLRVDTDLQLAPARGRQTVKFDQPGLGGVSFGAITGVSADGRTSGGRMNFDGRHLELVLPDAFVQAASYPMVLDPIISGYLCLQCVGNNDQGADVAYDLSSDTYLVVWERVFSASNIAIRAQRVNGSTGARIGGWIAVNPQLRECYNPAVANINLDNRFVITWQEFTGNSWDVKGRGMIATTATMGAEFVVSATSSNEVNPDICGDSSNADNEACIVYQDSALGIRWAEVTFNSAGAGIVNRRFTVSSRGSRPAVSKHGGPYPAAFRTIVVWQHDTNFIGARAMSLDSAPLSAVGLISGKNTETPEIAGDGTRFMAVYTSEEPGSRAGDIWAIRLHVPSQANQALTFSCKRPVTDQANDDERRPVVTDLGSKWLVAYTDAFGSVRTTLTVETLLDDCTLCGRRFEGGTIQPGYFVRWPNVVSKRSGGHPTSDEGLVVFSEHKTGTSTNVRGYRYAGSVGGRTTNVANGCSGGGSLTTSGKFAFGETFTYRLSGADSSSTVAALVLGWPGQRSILTCGTCRIMLGPVLVPVPIRGGSASFTLRHSCNPQYYGATIDAQFWSLRTRAVPCPTFRGLAVSNIVRNSLRD